jgi:hypothetical protein
MLSTTLVCLGYTHIFDLLCLSVTFSFRCLLLGNKTYRKIVDEYKCDYQRTTENSQKTLLAKKVIKKLDPKARFLKRSGDTWCVMNEREILKKIKQALREKDLWSKVRLINIFNNCNETSTKLNSHY